jgi:hypothetical protein
MRQFLAVMVLGAGLALTASAAFASDRVDYVPSFQPTQAAAIVTGTESEESTAVESTLAGGANGPASVWSEQRYDNFGQ